MSLLARSALPDTETSVVVPFVITRRGGEVAVPRIDSPPVNALDAAVRDALATTARVVFSVDARLSGRPQVPNDVVAEFAAENADVAIAFASIDPTRGPEAVREARRLAEAGVVRGLKLQNETVFFDFLDRSSPERR